MLKYIDMHCHLPDCAECCLAPDFNAITACVYNAAHISDWEKIIRCTNTYPGRVFGAIGIHPWDIDNLPADWEWRICDMLARHRDLMLGEIGIDKTHPGLPAQAEIFSRQLQIAAKYNRPVQIHCTGAWNILTDALKSYNAAAPIILHAYSGSADLMDVLIRKHNAYISFSPSVLNARHIRARRCAAIAPLSRILVESDARPGADIGRTVDAIAQIRGITASRAAAAIYNNSMGIIKNGYSKQD